MKQHPAGTTWTDPDGNTITVTISPEQRQGLEAHYDRRLADELAQLSGGERPVRVSRYGSCGWSADFLSEIAALRVAVKYRTPSVRIEQINGGLWSVVNFKSGA